LYVSPFHIQLYEKAAYPQALCVCPTRELARQIHTVVCEMGKHTKLDIFLAVKDANVNDKIKSQIVIGTPGRVYELIKKQLLILNKLKVFVLDEADVMLDKQGLQDQSLRIKRSLPRNCQILLFSATFKEQVEKFALCVVPSPNIIRVKKEDLTLDQIKQFYINCKSEEKKFQILCDIYGILTVGQSIIFVNTRRTAQELATNMEKAGHTVSVIMGQDMDSKERDTVIDDFRIGKNKVLIATNVLARGIDVIQVSLVVNYDIPVDQNTRADPETYVHRIGRTGRFGRKGVAINFVHDRQSLDILKKISATFNREIKEIRDDDLDQLEKCV